MGLVVYLYALQTKYNNQNTLFKVLTPWVKVIPSTFSEERERKGKGLLHIALK